jgi:hypothetical protein
LLSRLSIFILAKPSPSSLKMRYAVAVAVASLAGLAAAAPIKQAGDNWYLSYDPYSTYGGYPATVDAEAAKTNMVLDDAKMATGQYASPILF